MIADGWVDLQVNGYAGVDFSAPRLTVADVRAVVKNLLRRGTGAFCPTVTSSPESVYEENLPVLAAAMCEADLGPHLLGLHLEGPFLAPVSRGAHPAEYLGWPDTRRFDRWMELARGRIRLLTLAPELPGAEQLIRHARASGVAVSLGHHLADERTVQAAVTAGACCATHLGNGIAANLPRHPNPIWSQLACDGLSAMFITDGHHLPDSFIRVAWRAKGPERFIVTSDVAALGGLPVGHYEFMGASVRLEPEGRIVREEDGLLAGSCSTMADCLAVLARAAGLSGEELNRAGRINPLRLLETARQAAA